MREEAIEFGFGNVPALDGMLHCALDRIRAGFLVAMFRLREVVGMMVFVVVPECEDCEEHFGSTILSVASEHNFSGSDVRWLEGWGKFY